MSTSLSKTSLSGENCSTSIARLRIKRDLTEILTNGDCSPIIFVNQIDDDYLRLEAAILGPMSTPYENGVFLIDMKLPEQYPFLPPQSIIFKRATMHPNIDEYGGFKSELLKPESWSPAMTIKNILEHVWARLAIPDIDSNDCDPIRAHSYKTGKEQFQVMAREYSIKYSAAT